jgi:hypothetical protein
MKYKKGRLPNEQINAIFIVVLIAFAIGGMSWAFFGLKVKLIFQYVDDLVDNMGI